MKRYVRVFVILVVVTVFVYAVYSPGHRKQTPTVDISGLYRVETIVTGNEFKDLINGKEYIQYCSIDANASETAMLINEKIQQGNIVAYKKIEGLFWYLCTFNDCSEDWLLCFSENGSNGKVTKENIESVWCYKEISDIPEFVRNTFQSETMK